MLTVTVRHHFSAGHRILGLTGAGAKCSNLHGHTFGVEWTIGVSDTTATSVEFTAVKATVREWVDTFLDHGYIIDRSDSVLQDFLIANGLKHYPLAGPPTTEAIAVEIAAATSRRLPGIDLQSVTVTEGPNNAATWHKETL